MKASSLLPALLLLPALTYAQKPYTVTGKIGNLNAPSKIYLMQVIDGKMESDSVVLSNGSFAFKGKVKDPVKAYLRIAYDPGEAKPRVHAKTIFLEPGTINITSSDSLNHAVVKGRQANADNVALEALLKPVNDKQTALMAEYYAKPQKEREDSAFQVAFGEKYKAVGEERKALSQQFIDAHPKSYLSLDLLKSIAGAKPEPEVIEPIFAKLGSKVRKSADGVKFAERLNRVKALAVGKQAPEFTQNDPDGKPVSLASFRGKYVLIDFWASWCGPCRAENPHVVKAYNEFKDKNFTILGVSLDQPNARDKWLKAISDDKLMWTHVSDLKYWQNEVAQLYAINSIPQNFLLDPSGKIIARDLRGDALHKKLAELLP